MIGSKIDAHLQHMMYAQTNGIATGSTLMDFVAEMILGFADLQLSKCLQQKNIKDYKILRYRDDYRVFSNSPVINDLIIKCLTEVMADLGLKLNAEKTRPSTNIIQGSIKEDKLYWIKQKQTENNLQNYLLSIHNLSLEFPNSGSLPKALNVFYDKLSYNRNNLDIMPLLGILMDITHRNPRTYPMSAAIVSLLLKIETDNERKITLLKKITDKFKDIPNTGYLDVWLQRIALGINAEIAFKENLCNLVEEKEAKIWNFCWLKKSLRDSIDSVTIIDSKIIDNLNEIIENNEVALFEKY